VVAEGTDRFRVFVPFVLADGDHLCIILKRDGERWVFSDDGHTYMRLDGDVGEQIVSECDIEDRDGELLLGVKEERFVTALWFFVNSLLWIEREYHNLAFS